MTGERINLRVSTCVTSICDISAVNNTFGCDFTLSLQWDDPRIAEAKFPSRTYLTLSNSPLSATLRPDVFLINDLASENDRNLAAEEVYVENTERGTVINNRRMRGTFYHNFDLHTFPFDRHTFKVKMYFHPCYNLVGPVPSVKTSWWGRPGENRFEISDTIVDRMFSTQSEASGISFETYEFEIRVCRKYQSHLINIGAVVEGLFFLGLSVHMLEHGNLNDRINLTLVVVLSYSAFKMMIASMVPAIGYMTLLDIWVMTGFSLGVLGGLVSMGTVLLEMEEDVAGFVNKAVAFAEIGCWAVLHVMLYCKSGVWKRKAFLLCSCKDNEEADSPLAQSVIGRLLSTE